MLLLLIPVLIFSTVVCFGCWIYMVGRAFQEGSTWEGILCIIAPIGFILGWINSSRWECTPAMSTWSIAFVLWLLARVGMIALEQ